jgi:hypothetical protein
MDSASRVVVYPALSDTPSTVTAGTFITDAGGATSDQLSAVGAALSSRITSVAGMAGGGSVTSAELIALSATLQSAINTVSNSLSVETVNRISVDNALVDLISNKVSVEIVNRISADNAVSAAAQSAVNTQSARTDSVYSVVSALINRVSANSGTGGGSVTSAELIALSATLQSAINTVSQAGSVETAARISADNALSVRVDTVSNAVSALSQTNSANHVSINTRIDTVSAAAAAAGGPQIRIVSNTQSTNGSALVDISGLVLTVAADQTWEVQGMLLVSASAATVGFKGGCSVPVLSLPRFLQFTRISQGQSAGMIGGGGLLQVSGASQQLSLAALGGVLVGITYQGVFNVASAGTFRMMYAGIASTAASPVHIMPGSYMKAIRLK